MKATSLTCLFWTKTGCMSVRVMDAPVQETFIEPIAPPGMMHALAALGMTPLSRTFKRTCDGAMPVFEEQ